MVGLLGWLAKGVFDFVQNRTITERATAKQTFGDTGCHPERSEGSGSPGAEILSEAKDDSQDSTHVRSGEVLSPNADCKKQT